MTIIVIIDKILELRKLIHYKHTARIVLSIERTLTSSHSFINAFNYVFQALARCYITPYRSIENQRQCFHKACSPNANQDHRAGVTPLSSGCIIDFQLFLKGGEIW